MTLVIKVPGSTAAEGAEVYRRDQLLQGDNDGVRFLADLAFNFSYAGGAPANAAVIGDVAERADADVVLASGQTISYAGGGFSFSGITAPLSFLRVPASVAADIYNNTGGNQYFLACAYVKLPLSGEWNSAGAIAPFFDFGASYLSAPDLVMMAQHSGGVLSARRQTSVGAAAILSLSVPAGDFGQVAQIATWRNAAGFGARLKTASNSTKSTGASGSANSADFSASVGRFGIGNAFAAASISGAATWQRSRLFRVFIENLVRSGRDPETVLDADWTRTMARGVFS